MAKSIELTYKDETYTLEYTRRTIRRLEQSGFDIRQAEGQIVTTAETLFAGSFLVHHPRIKESKVNEIWNNLENKQELFEALVELYKDPIEVMLDEPQGDSKNHAKWKLNN